MAETTRDPAAIRAGIERARQEIEQSMNDLRTNVSEKLNWRSVVRRHPTAAFCGALALGVILARMTR
jgi:hypothetical protein